ncbi:hypothetical protein MOX02_00380 [Methylobacterium oxalidis]|uniref:Uncharacterized protein n=1 Tax=Methylobacterium oxalidis TaxID=944322 RepID=A0A512IWA3_9HYPH|nr:hypothetical protein MOX02_00380 [Methylobacterium oxalidis]GLS61945.1 hypothetical protein GCM10007888_03260 [Methylobacterium oxalidis]
MLTGFWDDWDMDPASVRRAWRRLIVAGPALQPAGRLDRSLRPARLIADTGLGEV